MQLNVLPSSPNIKVMKPRMMRWAGYVAHVGERRNTYGVLVSKPVGKRQLGRAMRRWENNVQMKLKGIERGNVKCVNLVHERDR